MDQFSTITIPTRDLGLLREIIADYTSIKSPKTNQEADLMIDAKRIQKNIEKILDIQLLKLQN